MTSHIPDSHRPSALDRVADDITLYTGDAAAVLAQLPGGSVHCGVTSPPYWGLRDYGTGRWVSGDPACRHSAGRGSNVPQTKDPTSNYPASPAHRGGDPRWCRRCGANREDQQLGLEATPRNYIDRIREVFTELRRVLADTGTVWLNLGDCYSSEPAGRAHAPMRRSTFHGESAPQLFESLRSTARSRASAISRKNLMGMPWRTAFALQADGWIVRNAIVWHKPNAMPESVKDRLSNRHELLFLLVKQQRYHFTLDPIREPLSRPEALHQRIVIGGEKGRCAGVDATARRRGHGVYGAKYADTAAFPSTLGPPCGQPDAATTPRMFGARIPATCGPSRPDRCVRLTSPRSPSTSPSVHRRRMPPKRNRARSVQRSRNNRAGRTRTRSPLRRYRSQPRVPRDLQTSSRRDRTSRSERGRMSNLRIRASQPALRLLSLGAGVQSTTVLLLACERKIPPFDYALFADTGWEPRAVYEQLATVTRIAEAAGIEVRTVSAGNIRRDALNKTGRFVTMPLHVRNPDGTKGMARRQCTGEYKIKPLKGAARELLGYPHPRRVPDGVFAV